MSAIFFFFFVSIATVIFILMCVNMYKAVKTKNLSKDSMKSHLVATCIFGISAFGALVSGVIWIVNKVN